MHSSSAPNRKLKLIVDELEEDILLGHLYPNEHLIEDVFTKRFNVKRHIIRKAFKQLQSKGMLKHSPGKGVMVIDYSKSKNIQLPIKD